MPRTRPPYPPEFCREAIRLVHASEEEHPIPKVATELGVTAETFASCDTLPVILESLISDPPKRTMRW